MDNEMKEMFKRIFIELDKINVKFTQVDSRFDKIDQRLDKVDQRLDNVDARLDKVEKSIDKLDNRMNVLEIKQERTANALEELKLAVILSEKNIRRDILMLKDAGETVEQVLRINKLIPV